MIVLYNPHVDDFLGEPPHFRLLRRRALKKYGYLLEGAVARGELIDIYVDGTMSAFVPERMFAWLPEIVRRALARCEARMWLSINNLGGKVRILETPDSVNGRVALLFSYKGATGPLFGQRLRHLRAFSHTISHLSHYFISTSEKSRNLERIANLVLAGDSDIRSNRYFQHFFPWCDRPLLLSPFAVAPRFRDRRAFEQRQAKAIATGTHHNLYEEIPKRKYRDFIQFFGTSTYHPTRKLLYDNREKLSDVIACHVTLFRGEKSASRNLLRRVLGVFSISQKTYFRLDLVELYNSHRYALVGEEQSGFPALGAFEAMACGCVLLAQSEFYRGWDMTPGVHFASHDGTIEGITSAINSLNADPARAAAIAANGKGFVQTYFQQDAAYASFVESVGKISKGSGETMKTTS